MMSEDSIHRPSFSDHLRALALGLLAGVFAGIVMLACMAFLRSVFFLPTPTELIFDRAFPLVTVDFFIGSLSKAGSYSDLKLDGVYAALAGQLAAAGFGGIVYAWFIGWHARSRQGTTAFRWFNPRGWRLVVPGVLGVWGLFVFLLHPQLLTNYHGRPPASANILTSLGLLVSFGVCGVTLMFFHALLSTHPLPDAATAQSPSVAGLTRRRLLASGVAALSTLALGGMLRRFFTLGTFGYDGTQYLDPDIAKVTPNDKYQQGRTLPRRWSDVDGSADHRAGHPDQLELVDLPLDAGRHG